MSRQAPRGWLTLAIALAAIALAACSGATPVSTKAPVAPSFGPISLQPPAGWAKAVPASGQGVVVAASAADLTAAISAGPRLSVAPVTAVAPDPSALIGSLTATRLVGNVTNSMVTIGGRTAVAVEWTESGPSGSQTYREVVVNEGGGRAWSIVMEAPAAGWSAAATTLQGIAGAITLP